MEIEFSYAWVTTAVAAAVFIVIFLIAALLLNVFIPNVASAFQPVLRPVESQIAPFLEQSPPDIAGLRAWLDSVQQSGEFQVTSESGISNVRFSEVSFVAVVDASGILLALEPGDNLDQSVETLLLPKRCPLLSRQCRAKRIQNW
ncbi:MAG: hypothetical protein H6656_07890 [Ardenticatenaceae bacterium]|nr:hypothetical protein [Ardenticatenaceae bacterium]